MTRVPVPLTPGSRLGPYEVSAQIGVGGMGEVYRARDTTLTRQVAIKVLPAAFASDPERLARFDREAKTLAALNHPNIAQIYGFEQVDGVRALVMELVEGETLAERSARAPIPIDQAIAMARQIAEALEAAHEQGIIHRDLKPANIKLRPDGVVKVLDFGLAKAMGADGADSATVLANSPTLSLGATSVGVILGTAAYMSPEQASGSHVDRRTDIWAFGAVLYEMLAGRKAFPGESISDTLATVLKVDPDWNALPADTPPAIRQLIRRCLTRDRKQRLQAIGEARIVLESPQQPAPIAPAATPSRGTRWLAAAVAVFAIAFSALAFVHFREEPESARPVQRFEVPLPSPFITSALVSPDGSQMVFWQAGRGQGRGLPLFVRRLDSADVRSLPATENARGQPFWSPDGKYIAFSAADGKLKTVDVTSGAVHVLCDATAVIGGFWTPDGSIVFSDQGTLMQVAAGGGTPAPLAGFHEFKGNARLPVPLLDGRHFVFLSGSSDGVIGAYVASRVAGDAVPKKIIDGVALSFAPSSRDPGLGYLLFLRNPAGGRGAPPTGELMAQRFDVRTLSLEGAPVLIRDNSSVGSASAGVLAFIGSASAVGDQLTIFDRQSQKAIQTIEEAAEYSRMSFSPDGSRIIAARRNRGSGERQLWMFNTGRGGLWSRFQTDVEGGAFFPVWSHDGSRIAFAAARGGTRAVYERLSNGGGEETVLFQSDEDLLPLTWSRDGQFLGLGAREAVEQTHFVLKLDSNGRPVGKPTLFVKRGLGLGVEFSPDPGQPRWIAYQSTRDNRTEVYLRQFDPNSPTLTPSGAGEWPVSKGGGHSPRWNPSGKELLYLAPDLTIMAVDFTGDPNAPTGAPRMLFKPVGIERTSQGGVATFSWSISAEGQKFLMPIPVAADSALSPLTVVLNWTSLLPE